MTNRLARVIIATMLLLMSAALSFAADKAPKPPHGYLNSTIPKLASVHEMGKRVHTARERPATIAELKDIVNTEIDRQELKLDI